MLIRILFILSAIVQLSAAFMAVGFIRKSRKILAWGFVATGLFIMSVRTCFSLYNIWQSEPDDHLVNLVNAGLGLLVSISLLLFVVLTRLSFDAKGKDDNLRKEKEAAILAAIIQAEENERIRFAKELHDGLGPLLSTVKMSVSTIKKQMGDDSDTRIIEHVDKLVDESIVTIKEISNNISPHILNNFGLYKAIHSFTLKIRNSYPVSIIFNSNLEGKRYHYDMEVVFYRVICELINNTLKHSAARKIVIDLFENRNELVLEYFDNGIGFDPDKALPASGGMGLANMRSRISSLNGTFRINNEPGHGVAIHCSVSLSRKNNPQLVH